MGHTHWTNLDVDTSAENIFLRSSGGRPVWPVSTTDEWQALTQLARTFGAKIREVRGSSGVIKAGSEEVVALGPETEEAARLYAHLTTRRFRVATSLADFKNRAMTAIVVTTPSELNNELLERLYTNVSNRSVPGIVCAATAQDLRRQVLIRAAAAWLCGPIETLRTDLYPLVPLSRFVVTGQELLGGEATPSEIRAALAGCAGVLTIHTHADGIDAFLGKNLTLCPIETSQIRRSQILKPLCQVTGFCHRRELSVEEALSSGTLCTPNSIAARIFVWNSCLGLLPPDGVINPDWSLGQRMLDSPNLGAVVTTWEMIISRPWHTEGLSRDLLKGMRVGNALARFNRSRAAKQFGQHRMCLLGDPRVRLPISLQSNDAGLNRVEVKHQTTFHRPAHEGEPSTEDGALTLLKQCLTTAITQDLLLPAWEALKAIQAYERAGRDQERLEGAAMRQAIIKFVFQRGKLSDGWVPHVSRFRKARQPSSCFLCGRLTNTIIARLPFPAVSDRRISICPRCGIVDDSPSNTHITFSLLDNTVELKGRLPEDHWNAGLLLASSRQADNIGWEWPVDPDGTPARSFRIPAEWPRGPLRLTVAILWEKNFAILSQPARAYLVSHLRNPRACRYKVLK
jgi:hypothetical protein